MTTLRLLEIIIGAAAVSSWFTCFLLYLNSPNYGVVDKIVGRIMWMMALAVVVTAILAGAS